MDREEGKPSFFPRIFARSDGEARTDLLEGILGTERAWIDIDLYSSGLVHVADNRGSFMDRYCIDQESGIVSDWYIMPKGDQS